MMVDILTEALMEGTGFNVFRQGSMSPDEKWPDSYYTFWEDDNTGTGFYDNDETADVSEMTLYFYSTDPDLAYEGLLRAKEILKPLGFKMFGKGFDVASARDMYAGRAIEMTYREEL